MSEFVSIMVFAAAIATTIGFAIQSLGKWFDFQTARINKELAKSKNEEAVKLIESQSQTPDRKASKSDARRWILRYIWKTQKAIIAWLLFLSGGSMVWGHFFLGTVTPLYAWVVAFLSPLCFGMIYLSAREVSTAYVEYQRIETNKWLAARWRERQEASEKKSSS